RVIEGLLDTEVGEAGHLAQVGQDLVGDLAVTVEGRALDLNVDRGWHAEVQNLRDHIGGGGGKRGGGGGAWGRAAAPPGRVGGGAVRHLQGHEDVRVARAERAGGVVHVIDVAIRQADVVEDVVELVGRNRLPYSVLDEVHQPGGFFDTCAGFGADVEEYLAAV